LDLLFLVRARNVNKKSPPASLLFGDWPTG
jgi:hypothetical protein